VQRRAEEEDRAAARASEAALREATWADAQAGRLAAEAERLAGAVRQLEADLSAAELSVDDDRSSEPSAVQQADTAAWEERAEQIRTRRERIAAEVAEQGRARRDAEARRARAEASISLADRRLTEITAAVGRLSERERLLATDLSAVSSEVAAAAATEAALRVELEAVASADRGTRDALAAAEAQASAARERLRDGEEERRAAEVAELEARLGLDAIREGLLVELAGLGELGLRHLQEAAGGSPAHDTAPHATGETSPGEAAPSGEVVTASGLASASLSGEEGSLDAVALERALDAVAPVWAGTPPPAEAPPSSRLGLLRRRFHELGASNPFAVEEYDALRTRLETLETQEHDLREAISRTRGLIAELNELVATQFRTTFRALEGAFDRRFRQLFGGGHARLTLTDPENLAATGIEIIARPPGKKAQSLAMLSGGERALTAVGLLFAMLEVRPVPFCVLDEVDAALDEANVGRFVEALRELAEATQFVVITHNRGTIEAADALYGVTVGDDSISRVISLRLEEAHELAGLERHGAVVDVLGG
jgi:chromosome segregation protein